ncbi:MAG: ATP-dependent DNA helicase RecG, partial [Eubacteriales bacterium]|nr:ATP-dependent DNA helicase RecG [Eubacteriales bacterium]
ESLKLEFLPEELRERLHLADDNFAVQTIHFPKNREELLIARRRLVFDEFLLFVLAVQGLKERAQEQKNYFPMKPVWRTEQIIDNLPYTLTDAQRNVWHEMEQDLTGHTLMSRLVQGDVGSGKTILAFLAMVLAAENGYQSALMVPTEVLARQHFEGMTQLLEENDLMEFSPVLLTGSQTQKEKRLIYEKIKSGEAKMIIGTHAVIQEKVVYDKLGLVITDEQHRFGVKQRESLMSRGNTPHVLVMSATPIPRTLAMILYGDLDISIVDQMPASRLPIKNCVVDRNYRPTAYRFIQNQVAEGRQAYIICPMVEESEELEAENVTDYTEQLREALPSHIRIEMLHGKMRPKEKNAVMERFAAGEIQVLVSTTVVEVGVNVPNATVMMVENAERFGLAQLHQLRGRVGRGGFQSYCIFIQGNQEEATSKRLKILNESNDGFFIAGEDLKLRGPGDVFGIRQSGLMEFQIGDIYQDAEVLKMASASAGEILNFDPDLDLPEHAELKKRLSHYLSGATENLAL